MFAVSVEFLHGTFRGDPDGTANTGGLAAGEWPPAPSRLFAAFVAADGTDARCRFTDGSELEWFEALPPPAIHADPEPSHNRLRPRFVVEHPRELKSTHHQEYVGRKGALVRPGVRVALRNARLIYSWEVEAPGAVVLAPLRRRAARIGYLGASDSPVRVRVEIRMPSLEPPNAAFLPDPEGDLTICVPAPGDLQVLDRMYQGWVERGAAVGRSQFPVLRHEVRYRDPRSGRQRTCGTVVAWLRLGAAVSGRRITSVTELFKAAVLNRYQKQHGDPPPVLHGHGFVGHGYELARFLALPDVGYARSRGRIHGLALWMPLGTDGAARRRAGDAALAVRRLTGRGVDVSVAPRDGDRPIAAQPGRWLGPSCLWGTAFPAIHERRRRLDLTEVTRWCLHAGLPVPVAFRAARTPLVPGAVDLAPVEVNRSGRPGLPYSHVEIRFREPVPGPVVIGSGRQRGFGLCAPLDPRPACG